jgi:hypothetical protein
MLSTINANKHISKRLEILRDFPLLELNQAAQGLAVQFLTRSNLLPKAKVATIHIAMDYLLTWYRDHIVNAQISRQYSKVKFSCFLVSLARRRLT